jgi:Lrp/AsnC family transcriptional regulator for asnA, asnC and gidA
MSVAKKTRGPLPLREKIGILRAPYRSPERHVKMRYAMRNDDQLLDETDQEIVRQLQQDGRRSYREMARSLDVSEGTVRWRVKRLQDTGALRIAAIADPFRLGYTVLASMFLRVSPAELERVIETLVGWQEVVYVSSCTGRVDVYIQVVCRSHEDLWELVAQRIPAVGGVLETETLMELKVHKLQYVYPGLDRGL